MEKKICLNEGKEMKEILSIPLWSDFIKHGKSIENIDLYPHFQSHYGLILSDFIVLLSHSAAEKLLSIPLWSDFISLVFSLIQKELFHLSIPLWSDFIYRFSAETCRLRISFNPTMV